MEPRMTVSLHFQPGDRVGVFAPHPDDETLACGELIQAALSAGARVRVVFATDGDNNPWPQRWLEKRVRIGPDERRRWGARRREEALAALAVLGLEAAGNVRFLGWPDQGLTGLLMQSDAQVATLADELAAFAPTHVVAPALADRHPDHSALRVMLDLALLRAGTECQRLDYVVHGAGSVGATRAVPSDPARRARKLEALAAHTSQIALSGGRLGALACRGERFGAIETGAGAARVDKQPGSIRLAQSALARLRRPHDLLLLLATASGVERWRLPLPRLRRARPEGVLRDADGRTLAAEWSMDALEVTLPASAAPVLALYAKIDAAWPRVVVFDRSTWHDAAGLRSDAVLSPSRQAAPGLT